MLIATIFLTLVLPVAWLLSEFQDRRKIRIATGVAALAVSYLVAAAIGSLQFFNANAWYGGASKDLIDTTIEQIEHGDTERLLQELKSLQSQYHPTYENRARYDKLIADFVNSFERK